MKYFNISYFLSILTSRIQSRDQCVLCGADPGSGPSRRQAVQRGQGPRQRRGERGGPRARQVRPGQEQRARPHQVSADGQGGVHNKQYQRWYPYVYFSRN